MKKKFCVIQSHVFDITNFNASILHFSGWNYILAVLKHSVKKNVFFKCYSSYIPFRNQNLKYCHEMYAKVLVHISGRRQAIVRRNVNVKFTSLYFILRIRQCNGFTLVICPKMLCNTLPGIY